MGFARQLKKINIFVDVCHKLFLLKYLGLKLNLDASANSVKFSFIVAYWNYCYTENIWQNRDSILGIDITFDPQRNK